MTVRERLETFWSGEKPDRIPYTIYENSWKHYKDDPAWQALYAKGLGVTWTCRTYKGFSACVERKETAYLENGRMLRRIDYHTEFGDLHEIKLGVPLMDEWTLKYLLETPEDYRVMARIVRNTAYEPNYGCYLRMERELPGYCIPVASLPPTPMQDILVELAGLGNFAYHLCDYEDEVMELYGALLAKFKSIAGIVAEGPGRFVGVMDNFTAESVGPVRFAKYTLPVYEQCFPEIRRAGKIVGCHYDGRLASCARLIASAPIDLIESLTSPPEGDMELAECRRAWPDKLFWVNIRVSDYNLRPSELRSLVGDTVAAASAGGRRLAFEVSEDVPANWKESIPAVLDTLNQL